MMKPDERLLLDWLLRHRGEDAVTLGRGLGDQVVELGVSGKRFLYLVEKWEDRGFVEFGVSASRPWIPEGGAERIREALEEDARRTASSGNEPSR